MASKENWERVDGESEKLRFTEELRLSNDLKHVPVRMLSGQQFQIPPSCEYAAEHWWKKKVYCVTFSP